MSKSKPSRWTCTNCGRSVPADVAECHCGTSRRAAERHVVEAARKKERRFSIPDLLGQLAVLGAVFYLGFAWRQTPPALPPPVGRPLLPSPDPTPPLAPAPVRPAPLAQAPFEPPSQGVEPVPEEREQQTSPLRTPSPEPSAAPASPRPEHSELDVKREQAEKRFDVALARLEDEARRLTLNADQFESLCVGGRGEPGSCQRLLGQISAGAESLGRRVQEAEEEARQAWVTPGTLRDLRQKRGLDEGTVLDQTGRVERLAARFRGR